MNQKVPQSEPAIPVAPSLAEFRPLSAAEAKVVAHLQLGDFDRLGDGLRPEKIDAERTVRADLLRYLILGNDGYRLHEKGLRLSGAWISGILDLEDADFP